MPSRKKTKGQARKAAKAKNEAAEEARWVEKMYSALEQSQIQRLQINNAQSSVPTLCMHGFDPFPNDDICIKFIRTFVREFYKYCRESHGSVTAERAVIACLSQALDSTQEEYSEVWDSSAKMKQVISYFLHNGTMNILANENNDLYASHSAFHARFFEEWLKVKVHKSEACIDWQKVIESARCDDCTVVKYFWRRIRCSCLDEKYEEVKSMPKMGVCFNHECSGTVERSKLRCCSRCRSIAYCSRECQAADWPVHKSFCDEAVAARAEFDASQKQQS